jgi:hypothetical protein
VNLSQHANTYVQQSDLHILILPLTQVIVWLLVPGIAPGVAMSEGGGV